MFSRFSADPNLGLKAPKGMGWLTDPRKALYNKVYHKTTRG